MLGTLFFAVVPVTCRSRAELHWQTQLSTACRSVYFFIFWHERSLTFKRTPINDAHELHLCAETSCAYQRCYFCKQFEGTASYGRIRVSYAHSLICKVCVHCECVCACVCVCTSKLSLPWRVQRLWPSWGTCGVTVPWAPSYLLCTLPAGMFLQWLCSHFSSVQGAGSGRNIVIGPVIAVSGLYGF